MYSPFALRGAFFSVVEGRFAGKISFDYPAHKPHGSAQDGSYMKLYAGGNLDFYLPGRRSRMELELKEPTRLWEVLAGLEIPLAEVHLVVVNGKLAELNEAIVSNEDQVKIYPAVNGG